MMIKKLRKYLGFDLPSRDFALKFDLPAISNKLQAQYGSGGILFGELNEVKEFPIEYFGILWDNMKYMNRCNLTPNQRISLTQQMVRLFFPAAIRFATQLSQRGVGDIPDPDDRRKTFQYIADIAKVLIISYQIVFIRIYKSSNFQYARSHLLRKECISSIFELMVLRQQVLAQRYQLLENSDWQGINTLFYAMNLYHPEDVQTPLPTLSKKLEMDTGRKTVSWKILFTQIHTVQQFDMLRWPRHLQWVVSSYIDSVPNAVTIEISDSVNSKKLGKNGISKKIAYLSNPQLLLDFTSLNNAIRKDCMGLLQSQKKQDISQLPDRFARFIETERLVVFNQLMLGILEKQPEFTKKDGEVVENLRIYVGFNEVFALLAHQQSAMANEVRLSDALARRSAKIAKDHTVIESSLWQLVEQTDNSLRLSTEENSYTTHMSLGSMVAYGINEGEIKKPKLAVITRIYRPTSKRVIVDFDILANYAESVIVTLNRNPQRYKALLIYDIRRGGHWRIVLQPHNLIIGFDQLVIERKGEKLPITLESWHSATTDFYLYSLTLTSAHLGIRGEPQYVTGHGGAG